MRLIGDIKDPSVRVDIASTIRYLEDLYSARAVDEKEIRNSLFEICRDVISATHADLTQDEVTAKATSMADDFIKLFKIEGLQRRAMSKFRVPMP
jgi:hypothetical protein